MLNNYYLSMALFLSMFILLFIVYITWRYRKIPITFNMSIMMLATFFYLIGYACKVTFTDGKVLNICLQIEYLGIAFIPVLLLILIFEATGSIYIKKSFYWIFFIVPALTIIVQQTNDWHHLLYRNISFLNGHEYALVYLKKGPWYWVHIVYSYFSIAVCNIVLWKYIKRCSVCRKKTFILELGLNIPWIYNLIYLMNEKKIPLNLTPLFLTVSDFLLVFTLCQMRMFKVSPLAFEKVFQLMSEAVIILDNHDQVIHFNGPAVDIFPELQGIKKDSDNIEDVFLKYPAIKDILCSNLTEETRFRINRNGILGVYSLKLTFIYDKKCMLGKILMLSDITAIEKCKENLSAAKAQLSALNTLKDRIIKVVTSDIKEPLDMLINLSEILKNSEVDPVLKNELICEMQKDISCIYLRIDNMLEYFQNKQYCNIYAPMNWKLSVLVEEAVKSIIDKATNKNISINCYIEDNINVYADKGMINIVLKNLLSNAVKYTNRNGHITLTACEEDDYIILSVKDTGIGMDAEKIQMLFQEVEDDPIPGTEGEVGMGLGLLLCRQIIKQNYGDIWVDSTVGEGSDFFVSIPAANESN